MRGGWPVTLPLVRRGVHAGYAIKRENMRTCTTYTYTHRKEGFDLLPLLSLVMQNPGYVGLLSPKVKPLLECEVYGAPWLKTL